MKKVIRAVSLLLLMAGMTGNAFAEGNENIIRQGAIRGRVIDNGKQILVGFVNSQHVMCESILK